MAMRKGYGPEQSCHTIAATIGPVTRIDPAHRHRSWSPDAVVAEIAARQGGVVSNAQLRAAGLDATAVARRVAARRLHPLGRGVYAVGHTAVTPDGRLFAAVLGTGGVLSHRSAAAFGGSHGRRGVSTSW
jgi:hypothetical protein